MKKLLEDIKLEFAIQLLYDYINIINIRIKTELDNNSQKLLQQQKEKVKSTIKEIYNGNENEISNVIAIYSPIVQQYYNKRKNENGQ